MAGKRKYQITDPAEARRKLREIERDPSRWGVNTDSLALAANADVATVAETRKTVARAQRYDAAALLHTRGCIPTAHLNSYRRLQDDIAIRTRTDGNRPDPVQGHHGSVELVTARSLEAADRVDAVLVLLAPQRLKDLNAILACPNSNWRPCIAGEPRKPHQLIRAQLAFEALNAAYVVIDRAERAPIRAVA